MAPTLFDHGAKPGDLIEISRGTYEHWAVYIGGNEVIHLSPPNAAGDSNVFMVLDSGKAVVSRQKIWEVVGRHSFEINNLLDDQYEPRDRHVIVSQACQMEGSVLPYNVITRNCEHFATELRYGKAESRQIKRATVIGGAALVGIGIVAFGAALFASLLKDNDNDNDDERTHEHRSQIHHRRYK